MVDVVSIFLDSYSHEDEVKVINLLRDFIDNTMIIWCKINNKLRQTVKVTEVPIWDKPYPQDPNWLNT